MEPQQPSTTPPAWTQYKPPVQPPMYPPQPMPPMQRPPSGVFVPTAVIVILAIAAVVVMCATTTLGYAIGATPVRSTPTTATSSAPLTTQQPTITSTPAKGVVLTVSGNGDKTTQSFTVRGTWQVVWTCNNGGDSNMTTLGFSIYDASTGDFAANADGANYTCPDGPQGGADSSIYHGGGTFYLSITADVDYTITVTDLPN